MTETEEQRRQRLYLETDHPNMKPEFQWRGDGPPPASWYAVDGTKVYRSYEDYCDARQKTSPLRTFAGVEQRVGAPDRRVNPYQGERIDERIESHLWERKGPLDRRHRQKTSTPDFERAAALALAAAGDDQSSVAQAARFAAAELRKQNAEIDRLRLLLHRCLCTMDADYDAPLIKDINDAGVAHVCSEGSHG